MAVDTYYALTIAQGIASVAPPNQTNPDNMAALTAPWADLGAISVAGLVENPAQTRTDFKRWGNISPFAAIITDQKKDFQVSFLESNANVLGVVYRNGGPLTASGAGTSEVQTVTITGGPTAGTFVLDFNGQPTTDLPYNASTSAVQSALQALSSVGAGNVTVTGSVGTYTITFGGTLANTNVPQLTAVSNLTGGTSPGVSVSTPTGGSSGQILKVTDDTTGLRDVRSLCFDLIQGTNHIRFFCPTAEMTALGNITYKFDGLIEYQCTFTAYPNASGVAVQRQFLLDAVVKGL
jgi:hypothetical protein